MRQQKNKKPRSWALRHLGVSIGAVRSGAMPVGTKSNLLDNFRNCKETFNLSHLGGINLRKIPLTQGKFALVDNEDFERVSQFKWYASLESRGTKWYAKRRTRTSEKGLGYGACTYMHHFVLGLPPAQLPEGHVVDHVNHNGLDNRKFIKGKIQLEVVTQTVNMERSPGWKRKPELAYAGPDRSNEW